MPNFWNAKLTSQFNRRKYQYFPEHKYLFKRYVRIFWTTVEILHRNYYKKSHDSPQVITFDRNYHINDASNILSENISKHFWKSSSEMLLEMRRNFCFESYILVLYLFYFVFSFKKSKFFFLISRFKFSL